MMAGHGGPQGGALTHTVEATRHVGGDSNGERSERLREQKEASCELGNETDARRWWKGSGEWGMVCVTSCSSKQEQVADVSALIQRGKEQSAWLLGLTYRKMIERERAVAQCLSSEAWWPAWQLEEH
jgi:hypothetical protein